MGIETGVGYLECRADGKGPKAGKRHENVSINVTGRQLEHELHQLGDACQEEDAAHTHSLDLLPNCLQPTCKQYALDDQDSDMGLLWCKTVGDHPCLSGLGGCVASRALES